MHLPPISHVLARAAPLLAPRQDISDSDYPACAQSCISYLSGSTNCITPGITAAEANLCLCNDIPYLSAVAKCTYNDCGVSILDEMAQISVSNCASTGTPSALTVQEMIDEGLPSSVSSAASSTIARFESTTSAAAPESTPTGSIVVNGNNNNIGTSSGGSNCVDCKSGGGGISQSDKIALGIGIGFGIPSVIIGIVGIWYARTRKDKEPKHEKKLRGERTVNGSNGRNRHSQYDDIEMEAGVVAIPELGSRV